MNLRLFWDEKLAIPQTEDKTKNNQSTSLAKLWRAKSHSH